jgi:hypothetical protein
MQRNQHYKFFIFQIFLIIFLFPSLSLATALKSIDAQPQAIGGLHNGALKNGFNAHQFLKNNPQVILVSPEEFQFSTREIAELVVQFASWVYRQWQYPLLVGDMSLREGGKIAEHKAHRNGLDIDIGYIPLKPTHIDQHLHRQHLHRSDKYNNRFPEKFEIAGKLSENFDKLKNFASFRLFQTFLENDCYIYRSYEGAAYEDVDRYALASRGYNRYQYPNRYDVPYARQSCPLLEVTCPLLIRDTAIVGIPNLQIERPAQRFRVSKTEILRGRPKLPADYFLKTDAR